jgi:hypothetical protein
MWPTFPDLILDSISQYLGVLDHLAMCTTSRTLNTTMRFFLKRLRVYCPRSPRIWARFPHLETLYLRSGGRLDRETRLSRLVHLEVQDCSKINSRHLRRCLRATTVPNLRFLSLGGLTGRRRLGWVADLLDVLPHLESLYLKGSLRKLYPMRGLVELSMDMCEDASLDDLGFFLPNLRILNLSFSSPRGALTVIDCLEKGGLPHLETLRLTCVHHDHDVECLERFRRLERPGMVFRGQVWRVEGIVFLRAFRKKEKK